MGSREEKSPYEVPREGGPLLLPFLPLGPSFPFLARGSIRGSGEKGSSSGYWYTYGHAERRPPFWEEEMLLLFVPWAVRREKEDAMPE